MLCFMKKNHTGLQIDKQTYADRCNILKNPRQGLNIILAGIDSRRLFLTVNRLLHGKPAKLYPTSN